MYTAAIVFGILAFVAFIAAFVAIDWDFGGFVMGAGFVFLVAGLICFIFWAVGDQSRYDHFVNGCNAQGGYIVGDGVTSNCVKDGKLISVP